MKLSISICIFPKSIPDMDIPGMNLNELESFIKTSEIKVLILRVFGSGTFFSDKNIENILLKIRENGTEIVIISQCISGEISVGKYDNSNIFKRIVYQRRRPYC